MYGKLVPTSKRLSHSSMAFSEGSVPSKPNPRGKRALVWNDRLAKQGFHDGSTQHVSGFLKHLASAHGSLARKDDRTFFGIENRRGRLERLGLRNHDRGPPGCGRMSAHPAVGCLLVGQLLPVVGTVQMSHTAIREGGAAGRVHQPSSMFRSVDLLVVNRHILHESWVILATGEPRGLARNLIEIRTSSE